MIRMIKKTSDESLYWKVWKVDKQLCILSGILGMGGEKQEIRLKLLESSKIVMNRLAKEKVNQGYEYVEEKALVKVAIQYRYEDEDQFDAAEEKSFFVEDLLEEALHSNGNGEFFGSEIGGGAGTTFCLVVDVELAFKTIWKELSHHNLIEGVEIAYLNEKGEYISLHPEGADFQIV